MKFPAIGLAVVAASMMAGCGPNLTATPTSPTTTPAQSPFVSRFGGFWDGATTVVRVTGGECVGEEYFSHFGTDDFGSVVISQTQTDVNFVVRSRTTGLSCRYSGTAGPGAFSLSTQRCEGVSETLVRCSNGAARVLEQIGSTVTATLNGNTATGTVATYFNVFADSTVVEERRPVAGMIVEEQFTAVRR
jgi:hypothetical protein